MIIVLKPEATEGQVDHLLERLRELGFKTHLSKGQERTIVGIIGDDRLLQEVIQPFPTHPLK